MIRGAGLAGRRRANLVADPPLQSPQRTATQGVDHHILVGWAGPPPHRAFVCPGRTLLVRACRQRNHARELGAAASPDKVGGLPDPLCSAAASTDAMVRPRGGGPPPPRPSLGGLPTGGLRGCMAGRRLEAADSRSRYTHRPPSGGARLVCRPTGVCEARLTRTVAPHPPVKSADLTRYPEWGVPRPSATSSAGAHLGGRPVGTPVPTRPTSG